jgi:hypothetical protein
MESKFSLPTETVELPSKGLLYPKESPLSSGTIEMKYMTAKEEDILTNQNYIKNGTVIDKLLQSLIVDKKINYGEILVGDKNALLIAARILSYGKDYQVVHKGEEITVDISLLKNKELDAGLIKDGKNEFTFKLPTTDNTVTFKLLTHKDQGLIDSEIKGLTKLNTDSSAEISTRLKYMITSVNGITERKDIRDFVDNFLLARDARELRNYYAEIQPDVDMTIQVTDQDGGKEEVEVAIGLNFFWPDAAI